MSEELESQYYVRDNQESSGPFSLRDIDVMYKTLSIRSNTLVWKEGMDDWKPLFKVDELRKLIDDAVAEYQNLPDINDPNHQSSQITKKAPEILDPHDVSIIPPQLSTVLKDPSGIVPSSEEIFQIVSSAIEQLDHERNLINIPDETLTEEEKVIKQKQIEKQQK